MGPRPVRVHVNPVAFLRLFLKYVFTASAFEAMHRPIPIPRKTKIVHEYPNSECQNINLPYIVDKQMIYWTNVSQNTDRNSPVKAITLPTKATCRNENLRNMAPFTKPINEARAIIAFTIVVICLASKPNLSIRCL